MLVEVDSVVSAMIEVELDFVATIDPTKPPMLFPPFWMSTFAVVELIEPPVTWPTTPPTLLKSSASITPETVTLLISPALVLARRPVPLWSFA